MKPLRSVRNLSRPSTLYRIVVRPSGKVVLIPTVKGISFLCPVFNVG